MSSGYHILHGTEAFLSSQKILLDSVAQAVIISIPCYGECLALGKDNMVNSYGCQGGSKIEGFSLWDSLRLEGKKMKGACKVILFHQGLQGQLC